MMNGKTVKDKCGFLAIGAYGGNQCVHFYKKGYPTLFVNTALQDLDSLTEVDGMYKYHIPRGEGCNKDRSKSKEIFKKDIDNIVNEIKEKMPGIEYLFIVGSSGGGTASGIIASMKRVALNALDDLKACPVITVLPNTKQESVKALLNCYETLSEIEQIGEEPGATFILDNDKNTNKLRINEMFFWYLDALLSNQSSSVLGNVDNAEIEELISTPGMAIISKLGKDKSDTQQLISTFHNNIYAPMEKDKVIKYIGLISSGKGKEIQIEDIYDEVGSPLDCFTGYEAESTICILAGLSLPYEKMAEIKEKIDSNKSTIQKKLMAQKQNRLSEGLDFFTGDIAKPEVKPVKRKSNRDCLF